MNIFWVVLVTVTSVAVGTGLCFWLLSRAQEVDTTVWILEHVVCPIFKIITLLIMVSLVYPAMDETSTSMDFWRVLSQQGQFNNLINILFFGGLAIAFIPIINHPVFALPLQVILTTALVFNWQYEGVVNSIALFPSVATWLKIIAYMGLIYFVTREASIYLSRKIDSRMAVSGSIRIISDAFYLVFQIPVILIYAASLKLQLG